MRPRGDGPTALDLVEEATHLIRRLPATAAAAYGLGVVPFVLGVTFFIADMSRGANAAAHLPGAALGLVLAFAWMKAWQAIAAEHALAALEQRAPQRLGARAFCGLMVRQFSHHAFGLVLIPVSLVLALPAAWVYAYYQNLTVLGVDAGSRAHKSAWEQARLWPGQNHMALGAISILAILVLVNVGIALYAIPWLVRTITGTERVFAQTGWNVFNSTFLAAVFGLGFLVLDPVFKAFYVLRCFYGRSRRTGVDLLVQVREAVGRAAVVVMIALLGLSAAGAPALRAEETAEEPRYAEVDTMVSPAPDALTPEAIDSALDRVLEQPEYTWRDPHAAKPEGALSDFARWLGDVAKSITKWWRGLFERDEDEMDTRSPDLGFFALGGRFFWGLLLLLAVAVVVLVIITIVKRSGVSPASPASASTITKLPKLDGDDVTADHLPEEEWMKLARDLIARGDVRLGLRALFLGSLAGLAGRGLLVLARHKSNRDYERELRRRGAPLTAVVSAFAENRRDFEGVWYGGALPAPEEITRFEQNVQLLVRKDAA